ncbi:hypothetical protein [Brachybacterium epidermidis]|uniref:hypothetical protein n=1 Tax=Brachybacterium epidermidis TaxID=2781983 RepID=UPI00398F7670
MSVRGPVMVSRTGYAGELGHEVFVNPSQATEVWNAISESTPGLVSCPVAAWGQQLCPPVLSEAGPAATHR